MNSNPELGSILSPLGLEACVEMLAPYATVELALVADEQAEHAIGCTRIGGAPDLPSGMAWPSRRWPLAEVGGWPDYARAEVDACRALGQAWTDGDELVMPLPFLMQLDLATIARLDARLPTRGVLSFFAAVTSDIEDARYAKRVAAAVTYAEDISVLVPRRHPPTQDAPPSTAVTLRPERSIHWNIAYEDMPKLEAALPKEAFAALVANVHREVHAVFPAPAEECAGPMPPLGEVALLRLHDHAASGFCVGDASWITFSIPELALREHRFEEACASVFIG